MYRATIDTWAECERLACQQLISANSEALRLFYERSSAQWYNHVYNLQAAGFVFGEAHDDVSGINGILAAVATFSAAVARNIGED